MAGIYFHIPFCKQKCTYCDFHFSTRFYSYENDMLDMMVRELVLRKNEIAGEIETLYFGGGTPSIAQSEGVGKLVSAVREHFSLLPDIELTLEANPDDITPESVRAWKAMGINRLSIGIQSFDEEDLRWMNRAHNAGESLKAVQLTQESGITNISIDLIYGLPEMDEARWNRQLDRALALGVKHISAYCLTVEKKTTLEQLVKQQKIIPANNDMQALHFEILQERLKAAGFVQYEVSNFGLPGFFSRHNSAYWKGKHYLGIGPSAHSFDGQSRSWNIPNNALYIKELSTYALPIERETLAPKDRFNELLLTGLRTIWGVDLEQLGNILPLTTDFERYVKKLSSQGQAEVKSGQLILTESGMLYADRIASDLFY